VPWVVVAERSTPDLIALLVHAKGLIVRNGGVLAHAVMICRTLQIPCVVGVSLPPDLPKELSQIEVNGSTGEVRFWSTSPQNKQTIIT